MLLDRLLRAWAYLTDTAAPGTACRSRLGVEAMEDRAVPTAVPLTAPNGGEWFKVDTISVAVKTNRDAASGVQSNVVLGEGVTYLAVARGTARIAINETGVTDAEYIRYNKSTGPQDGSSPGYAPHNHGVRLAGVDGGTTAGNLWGAYQADHQYVREFVGQGTVVAGYYSDISSQYNDNSGTLEVDLYAAVPTVRALYVGTALTFAASDLGLASIESVSQPSHGSVEDTGATLIYTGDIIDVTDALPESDTLEVTGFAADGSLLTATCS